MTVIVWDGTTLAADKQANSGSLYRTTKIFRVRDMLVGVSGCFIRGLAMRDWLAGGGSCETFPHRRDTDDKGTLLVVHQDGRVERYEDDPHGIPVEETAYATGSGCDAARAALLLGCNAVQAVEIASRIDPDCGLGVDVLSFSDTPSGAI